MSIVIITFNINTRLVNVATTFVVTRHAWVWLASLVAAAESRIILFQHTPSSRTPPGVICCLFIRVIICRARRHCYSLVTPSTLRQCHTHITTPYPMPRATLTLERRCRATTRRAVANIQRPYGNDKDVETRATTRGADSATASTCLKHALSSFYVCRHNIIATTHVNICRPRQRRDYESAQHIANH